MYSSLRIVQLIVFKLFLIQLSFSEIIRLKDGEITYEYDNSSEPLGRGAFAIVYSGVRIEKNRSETVVFKVLKHIRDKEEMLREKNIYEIMGEHDSLPKFHHYFPGTNETKAVLVIERLGKTLTGLWNELRPFSIVTVSKIGLQILDILEWMHSNGFSHGDLHWGNVAVGYENNSKIYLFDFNCVNLNEKNSTFLLSEDLYFLANLLKNMIRPSEYYNFDVEFEHNSEFDQICQNYSSVNIHNEGVRNETFSKLRHILRTELEKHKNDADYERMDIGQLQGDAVGINLLFKLIKQNDTRGIERLIQQGININTGYKEYLPIHLAAELGNAKMVQILIDHGAEINADISPLYFAVRAGKMDIAKILIELGSKINIVDNRRKTLLHYSAIIDDVYLTRCLIERDIFQQINAVDTYEKTAIHYAAENGNVEIIRILIEHGAKVNILDYFNRTPIRYATDYGHTKVAVILEEAAEEQLKANKSQ